MTALYQLKHSNDSQLNITSYRLLLPLFKGKFVFEIIHSKFVFNLETIT